MELMENNCISPRRKIYQYLWRNPPGTPHNIYTSTKNCEGVPESEKLFWHGFHILEG